MRSPAPGSRLTTIPSVTNTLLSSWAPGKFQGPHSRAPPSLLIPRHLLELPRHNPGFSQDLPEQWQDGIVLAAEVELPDLPAGNNQGCPEFVMGAQKIAGAGH